MREHLISAKYEPDWSREYVRLCLSKQVEKVQSRAALERFRASYRSLPPDPHDESGTRYRAYGRCVFLPWIPRLEWVPYTENGSEYFQGIYNYEHPDQVRLFGDIPGAVRANEALTAMLDAVLQSIIESGRLKVDQCYHIGIHQVSQCVNQNKPVSAVSPNSMHQDGELFDFAILIARENVVGGENCIASVDAVGLAVRDVPQSEVHEHFTMTSPLEGFGVFDAAVSHGVTAVELGLAGEVGWRDTLLVDVLPLVGTLR